jgi:mRNA interferase HicA
MIKRIALERHLRQHGCAKVREGGRHSVWHGPKGTSSTVPRHRQIPRTTAQNICKQLGVPKIS